MVALSVGVQRLIPRRESSTSMPMKWVVPGDGQRGNHPGIPKGLTDSEITATIHQGKGRMPTFPNLSDAQLMSLLEFLHEDPTATTGAPLASDKQEMASV